MDQSNQDYQDQGNQLALQAYNSLFSGNQFEQDQQLVQSTGDGAIFTEIIPTPRNVQHMQYISVDQDIVITYHPLTHHVTGLSLYLYTPDSWRCPACLNSPMSAIPGRCNVIASRMDKIKAHFKNHNRTMFADMAISQINTMYGSQPRAPSQRRILQATRPRSQKTPAALVLRCSNQRFQCQSRFTVDGMPCNTVIDGYKYCNRHWAHKDRTTVIRNNWNGGNSDDLEPRDGQLIWRSTAEFYQPICEYKMHLDFEAKHLALLMPRTYEAEDEMEWSARILTVTDDFNCFVERYADNKYIVRAYTHIGAGTQLRLMNRLQLEPLRGIPTVLKSNKGWLMGEKLEIELINARIPTDMELIRRFPLYNTTSIRTYDFYPGLTCPTLRHINRQISSRPRERKH
jgi:hypothetical protein